MKAKIQKVPAIFIKVDWLRQYIPIASILLLATALYFYKLGRESLWIDELYSVHDAKNLSSISMRPLYYILLHFWMQFGTSDAWLRVLAVLFGLGSIVLTYQLGCRLVNKPTGLIAALLLTLSPLFINHAQEVRMYTLSTFLGLGGTLALAHALEQPTIAPIGWWAGARLLAILTTPLDVTLLLPDIVLIGWRFRTQRRVLLTFGKGLLFIGVAWLPIAIGLATKSGPEFMAGWIASRPKPGVVDIIVHPLRTFTVLSQGIPSFEPLDSSFPLAIVIFYKLYTIVLVGVLVFAFLNRHRSARLFWIAAWALLPLGTILLISYISSSIWLPRYLLLAVPYVLILLAVGFLQIWRWQQKIALLVALVYAVAVSGGLAHYYTTQYRPNLRGVLQIVSSNEKTGDALVMHITYPRSEVVLEHYYHGSAPIYWLKIPRVSPQLRSDQSNVVSTFSELPSDKSRFWIVYQSSSNRGIERSTFRELIKKQFHLKIHQSFHNQNEIEVFLVTPLYSPTNTVSEEMVDDGSQDSFTHL